MFIPSFPSVLALFEKGPFAVIFGAAAIIAFLIFFTILIKFFGIWLQARTAGAPVSLLNLVFMRFRKVPPALIVNSRITAVKAGLPSLPTSSRPTTSLEETSPMWYSP